MATTPPTSSTIITRVSVASTTTREVTSVETTTHAAATTTEAAEATTEVVVATTTSLAANASSLIWAVSRCSRDTRCLNSKCPCPCRCKCQWPQSRATWSRFLSSIWASSILWLRSPPLSSKTSVTPFTRPLSRMWVRLSPVRSPEWSLTRPLCASRCFCLTLSTSTRLSLTLTSYSAAISTNRSNRCTEHKLPPSPRLRSDGRLSFRKCAEWSSIARVWGYVVDSISRFDPYCSKWSPLVLSTHLF